MSENKELLKKYINKFINKLKLKDEKLSKNTYIDAVNRAYNDAKRVLSGIGEYEPDKNQAIHALAKSIEDYFDSSKKFNHDAYCVSFRKPFENKYEKVTYGVAQKIVNLTFKYLFCNKILREQHRDKFKECHMVLDSFILSWYKENDLKPKITKSWSNLKKEEYEQIQKAISKHVETKTINDKLCPLEYEFILWPNAILYEAAMSWMTTMTGKTKKQVCNDCGISGIKYVKKAITHVCDKTSDYVKDLEDGLDKLL